MTREAIEQGFKIQKRINEIDDIIQNITPYYHSDIEIDVQKKVGESNGKKLHYRLSYDSPLWLAIGSALSDMKAELQHQFDSLDCNCNEEPSEPMRQTKAWWKFWEKK